MCGATFRVPSAPLTNDNDGVKPPYSKERVEEIQGIRAMNKRHAGKVQTPVVLLAFLVIAGGTFLLAKRTNQPSREQQIQAQKHLNPYLYLLKEDDIDKVVIDRGETKIVLERKGPRWQMTEPLQVLADTSRVNDVIRNMRNKIGRAHV